MKKHICTLLSFALLLAACKSEIDNYSLPELLTTHVTDITSDGGRLHGHMTNDVTYLSYAQRAFEICTNPNFDSPKRYYVDKEPVRLDKESTNYFSTIVNDLSPQTTYYCRAVLSKSTSLSEDIYGNTVSFTTKTQQNPKVTFSLKFLSITSSTIMVDASCTAENCTLSVLGFLVGDATFPTINNNIGSYSLEYSTTAAFQQWGLQPSTTYFARLYAIDTNNKVYYSTTYPFTTKHESGGGPLTINDFIGTYTLTAYSPWESKDITWTNVQIIPANGDTVFAVGFEDSEDLRAVGIFDQSLQQVRFESGWYFESYQFNYNSTTCVAEFVPIYYNSNDKQAYIIKSGGKFGKGEIRLNKLSGNTYKFVPCDGASFDNQYANGFIFDYHSITDFTYVGNSYAYINVSMTRTSTTTNKSMPAKKLFMNKLKQTIHYENNNAHRRSATCNARTHQPVSAK